MLTTQSYSSSNCKDTFLFICRKTDSYKWYILFLDCIKEMMLVYAMHCSYSAKTYDMKIYANGFANSHFLWIVSANKKLCNSQYFRKFSSSFLCVVLIRMWIVCLGKLQEKRVQILKKIFHSMCSRNSLFRERNIRKERIFHHMETFEKIYYKKQDIYLSK